MVEEHYFFAPDAATVNELPKEEARHAVRVLRMKPGDIIHLMDGKGMFFVAEITFAGSEKCIFNVLHSEKKEKAWTGKIHLAVAPTKMIGRMEWLVEKATEVGVDEITFLNCQFSERRKLRTDRLENIMISAMKQSRKPLKVKINDMIAFRDFVCQADGDRYIAHCFADHQRQDFFELLTAKPKGENVTIMIGPEGDFSAEEVALSLEKGFLPVTLGESRLRTETAALSAVMMSQLALRKV